MIDPQIHILPTKSNWRFDEIASSDSDRAHKLDSVGSPKALLSAVEGALDRALSSDDVRLGREQAELRPDDCRVVIQFGVGTEVFDWFFNARTGYRAHFRAHYSVGLDFNREIIDILCGCLARLPEEIQGRDLNSKFEDCGEAWIPQTFVLDSLVPDLSKVWFCVKRIQPKGGIELLPPGVVGPRLLLNQHVRWAAPYREENFAWLDVKGAFVGQNAPYQPKDPICRAKRLHHTGEA